jgi:hypothetical protein
LVFFVFFKQGRQPIPGGGSRRLLPIPRELSQWEAIVHNSQ